MKICIDPGHYGSDYNPGVAAGYVESNFTWTYHLLLKERLQKHGVEVVTTRETKAEDLGLQARGKKAEGCDLFISVHSNAVDNKPEMNAVFCHFSVRSGGEGIAREIADRLTDFFRGEWGAVFDPSVYSVESTKYPGYDYYGVLKGVASVAVPGIIVEHSFHTNKKYCEWAMIPGNLEKMADAEVAAIVDYYGLDVPISPDDGYYIRLDMDLKRGDKGNEVKNLQRRMRQVSAEFDDEVAMHSFKDGQPDGSFGGRMEKTLKKFQQQAGIPLTGMLDAETREVLNTSIAKWHYDAKTSEAIINNIRKIIS